MVLRQQLVERTFLKLNLVPYRMPQSFGTDPRWLGLRLPGSLTNAPIEQSFLIHRPSSRLPDQFQTCKILNTRRAKKFSCLRKIHSLSVVGGAQLADLADQLAWIQRTFEKDYPNPKFRKNETVNLAAPSR
jgi:hypothetical protein